MPIRTRQGPKLKRHQGQATVEFALVISLLFLVIFGIIDFSRLIFAYATMSNGVREGARFGITYPDRSPDTVDEMRAAVEEHARAMMVLIGGNAEIEIEFPDNVDGDPYCAHFCRIVVRATTDFSVWTPIIPNIPIEAQATMHFE